MLDRKAVAALKSLLAVAFSALLLATSASAQEKFKAVTTFTVIADMAQNVAGDVAIVESITKPGAEIHEYQPTPGILFAPTMPSLFFTTDSIWSCGSRSFIKT